MKTPMRRVVARSATGISRRTALSGAAVAVASMALEARKAFPAPQSSRYEVLEVGPGKRFRSLTLAGCYMNGIPRWNNGYAGAAQIAKMGFHIIISPGPPGYYTNDSGSHSRRWPELVGWPPYEGGLLGPVIIEGDPGKPAPVLDTDGNADGVLYYQTGLFATGSCDATFRHLVFRGFRRSDGIGNYAAVRLGQTFADIAMNSHVLFEDCEISGCDNGVMGGAKGQSLTLRRCYFHDNGNEGGRSHNVYFSDGDALVVEDMLSTRCTVGHLLKTRGAVTVIRNGRLLGNGGTESSCLDVPDGGVLDVDGLVCEKSPGSDASWLVHYSGENQDQGNGVPFRNPAGVNLRNVTLIAPPALARHPSWGPIVGFANQSGLGEESSGRGSHFVAPLAQNIQAYGLSANRVGLPCTVLKTKPALDLTSPVRG